MTLLLINFNFSEVCWQSWIWSILIWSIFIWSIIATHRTSSLTIPKFKNLFYETPSFFTKSFHGSFQSFYRNVGKTLKIIILIFFQKTIHMTHMKKSLLKHQEWKRSHLALFKVFSKNQLFIESFPEKLWSESFEEEKVQVRLVLTFVP